MTYKTFINEIITILSGTTYSGYTYLNSIEFCLESEIGLNKETVIENCTGFITPVPVQFNELGSMKYSCKVYLLAKLIDKDTTQRINVYDRLLSFTSNVLYKLQTDTGIHEAYPIEITPTLFTDFDADGIQFTISSNDSYDCNI